ncbi:MAG: SLBB domain-containing protein [Candidatus Wallbacteria bacterium]|nr:SLBB domain-containing protein [Candidatus Wallbacteria bacterium]
MEELSKIREAGIVGAGGAGFPTYFKLNSRVETVIGNGAECEPLLKSDQFLMKKYPGEILKGLSLIRKITGAQSAILALKEKYESFETLSRLASSADCLKVFGLGNFYPAGDEQALTYEVTGRIVPEGGLPLQVGVVVDNVATIYQVFQAVSSDLPVTERVVTITGEVKNPVVGFYPIGTSVREALESAGGTIGDKFVLLDGGPMMGKMISQDSVIEKTTSGILVLPENHPISLNRALNIQRELKRDFAVCCNCTDCTRTCPRYQLGHALEPHRIMQSIVHNSPARIPAAFLCCECGACEFGCPMGLSPRNINQYLKSELKKQKVANPHQEKPDAVRSQREWMKIPPSRLLKRFRLEKYYQLPISSQDTAFKPSNVKINLAKHIGEPAVPLVRVGQKVKAGEKIAAPRAEAKLSSNCHASISGSVMEVTSNYIRIGE